MIRLKKIFQVQFMIALSLAFLFTACAENPEHVASSLKNVESAKTRNISAAATSAMAMEYGYKSLASFKNGQSNFTIAQMAELAGKDISIVVLFESEAPWALPLKEGKYDKTGDDSFNAHLQEYSLKITKLFPIDEGLDALVLEGVENLEPKTAVDAAKALSMVDFVEMVDVKELPSNKTPNVEN